MKQTHLIAFFLFFFVTASNAQVTFSDSIYYQSGYCRFLMHLPDGFNKYQELPVVLALPGENETASQMMAYSAFNNVADSAHVIVVYPEFAFNRPTGDSAIPEHIAKLNFVSSLLDSVLVKYGADDERVYVAGFSKSGFLAQELVMKWPNRFTAAASVAASSPGKFSFSDNTHCPKPVLFIHGTSDSIIPFNGNIVGDITVSISSDSAVSSWARRNDCAADLISQPFPDIDTSDHSSVIKNIFRNCYGKSSIIQYVINDGGHTWPGAIQKQGTGNMNKDINATAEIWTFFRSNTMDFCLQAESMDKLKANKAASVLSVFPNPVQRALFISYSDGSIHKVEILDHEGNKVLSLNENQITYPINVSQLPTGHYMLKVYTGDGESIKSMMVKE